MIPSSNWYIRLTIGHSRYSTYCLNDTSTRSAYGEVRYPKNCGLYRLASASRKSELKQYWLDAHGPVNEIHCVMMGISPKHRHPEPHWLRAGINHRSFHSADCMNGAARIMANELYRILSHCHAVASPTAVFHQPTVIATVKPRTAVTTIKSSCGRDLNLWSRYEP